MIDSDHQTELNTLIAQVYDAVSEPGLWGPFLDKLTLAVGAHAARMRLTDTYNTSGYALIAGTGHDAAFDKEYGEYYSMVDPWNPHYAQQPAGAILNSEELAPIRLFLNSEMYNDFWRHYEIYHVLGTIMLKTDNHVARIGFHRSRSCGPYSEQEVHLLQQVAPHLLRAFKLGRHLESMQTQLSGIEEALNLSTTPLILLDEREQVAFINQRAEALLGKESGLLLKNNYLTAVNDGEKAVLSNLLQQAVLSGAGKGCGSGSAIRLNSADGSQRYNLLITPYPDHSVSSLGLNRRICAAVFIHDSQPAATLPADILKTLYGLTRSEIRLAEAIIEGLTPAEAAARFCVSVNTTRSQLRALFAKTDTSRQAELVKLLLGITQ